MDIQTLGLTAPALKPFGAQAEGLTRFGSVWINLGQIDGVNFAPADGCGAEVDLRSGNCIHLNDEDAQCLRSYLEGLDSVRRTVEGSAREDSIKGLAPHSFIIDELQTRGA